MPFITLPSRNPAGDHHCPRGRWMLAIIVGFVAALLAPINPAGTPGAALANGISLVGYWPFDSIQSMVSPDASGFGNPATVYSSTGLSSLVAPTDFANPYSLNSTSATGTFAIAPGSEIDGLSEYTIAFWLRLDPSPTPTATLLSLGNGKASFSTVPGANAGIRFDTTIGGVLRTFSFVPTTADHRLNDGWFHHLAASYDGAQLRLYVDGIVANGGKIGGAVALGSGVYFGSYVAPFDGQLDDVRIYNGAISPADIGALGSFACGATTEIPGPECDALVALYNGTDGPHWLNAASWLRSTTPCSWYGVQCAGGHVVALRLPGNQLTGVLPAQLASLTRLTDLDLSSNQISGPIPYELSQASALTVLDLANNKLSGQVPSTLGQDTGLTTLRLANNQLRGAVPPQLVNLVHLTDLDLRYNMLTAADRVLLSYLDANERDWASTQTVPPSNVSVTQNGWRVALRWTPIAYTGDGGYYDVLVAPQTTGRFTSVGTTAKTADGYDLTSLAPGATYSISVRTITPKHGSQQNDLVSDASDPFTVTLPPNGAPVAAPDSYSVALGGSLTVDPAHGVVANDSDPEHEVLTVATHTAPATGSLQLASDGGFVYTPSAGATGTDTFTYRVSDGHQVSNPSTVTITVTPAPTPTSVTPPSTVPAPSPGATPPMSTPSTVPPAPTGPDAPTTGVSPAISTSPNYTALSPARLFESRSGLVTVDGVEAGVGVRAAGSVSEVQVAGRVGVPVDATSAVLNVTVTGGLGDGFLTVFPCGAPRPTASSVNFSAGQTIANAVVSKIGAGGAVCVFTSATTDLVVDINGYFPAG